MTGAGQLEQDRAEAKSQSRRTIRHMAATARRGSAKARSTEMRRTARGPARSRWPGCGLAGRKG